MIHGTMIHEVTMAEKAYQGLLDEKYETLSEAARSILGEATTAAYAVNLVRSYCFQPEEYDEAMEKMRLAATRTTQEDHEILAEIVQAGFLAALSIDPDDETPAGYKVYWGNYHWYYRMSSGMINDVLKEGVPEPIWPDEETVWPDEDVLGDVNEAVRRAVADGW